MFYAIISEDVANSLEKRLSVRERHLQRLRDLASENRLLTAGPFPLQGEDISQGVSGSLIIAAFDSLETAKQWADADPYIEAGVYTNTVIKPYKAVLPNDE